MQRGFIALGAVNADQAPGLQANLNRATAAIPALTGELQQSAGTVTVTSAASRACRTMLVSASCTTR